MNKFMLDIITLILLFKITVNKIDAQVCTCILYRLYEVYIYVHIGIRYLYYELHMLLVVI